MILSCVKRIQDKLGHAVGIGLVCNVLRGSRIKRVLELELDELSTFGLMKTTGRTEIHNMADQLEADGYLKTESEFQTISLTPAAGDVLYRGKKVSMMVQKEPEEVIAIAPKKMSGEDADLFDALKELRMELAKEAGVPAYVVFSNATLTDMAKKRPKTMSEFKRVSGVGEIKAQWYGTAFLKRIQRYLDENA